MIHLRAALPTDKLQGFVCKLQTRARSQVRHHAPFLQRSSAARECRRFAVVEELADSNGGQLEDELATGCDHRKDTAINLERSGSEAPAAACHASSTGERGDELFPDLGDVHAPTYPRPRRLAR